MFKLGLIFICLALGGFIYVTDSAYLSVDSFFNTNGNLATITWVQNINSLNEMSLALNSTAMMLEGEVRWGLYNGTDNFTHTTLIMGKSITSDLTLLQFLNSVENHNANLGNQTANLGGQTRKGVQLNFRSISEVAAALIPLLTTVPRLGFPVWLHAEILPGPWGALPYINARDFFDLVIGFRNSTLSLAWTPSVVSSAPISTLYIDIMVHALEFNSVQQAVTFPVRADIASMNVIQLQNLINRVPRSTLKIWGTASMFNQLNTNNIRNLLNNIGVNRTLLDVPEYIRTILLQTLLSNSSRIIALSIICLLLNLLANLT